MTDYTVWARHPDLTIAGILTVSSLKAQPKRNEVGSIQVTVPPEMTPIGWPAPGCGIIVVRNRRVWVSGSIDENAYAWSADATSDDTGGRWSLTFDTDLARIGYRLIYPEPAKTWTEQQAPPPDDTETGEPSTEGAWYTASGNAEELLRGLVDTQAGPGAIAARRVPGLSLGPAAGVGTDTSVQERFTALLDAMRTVATAGGGLNFDVRHEMDAGLVFTVWAPVDRTDTVRFAPELGNVTALSVTDTSPKGTVVLTAGSGQLKQRAMVETADADADPAWQRREIFRDQRQVSEEDTDKALAEYTKDAEDALVENREQASASVSAIDTPSCAYGTHYDLGDTVTVGAVAIRQWTTEVVGAVDVDVDDQGNEDVTVTVGDSDTDDASDVWVKPVRQLQDRISYLERAL